MALATAGMGREIGSKEEHRDLETREDPPFEGQAIPGRVRGQLSSTSWVQPSG